MNPNSQVGPEKTVTLSVFPNNLPEFPVPPIVCLSPDPLRLQWRPVAFSKLVHGAICAFEGGRPCVLSCTRFVHGRVRRAHMSHDDRSGMKKAGGREERGEKGGFNSCADGGNFLNYARAFVIRVCRNSIFWGGTHTKGRGKIEQHQKCTTVCAQYLKRNYLSYENIP